MEVLMGSSSIWDPHLTYCFVPAVGPSCSNICKLNLELFQCFQIWVFVSIWYENRMNSWFRKSNSTSNSRSSWAEVCPRGFCEYAWTYLIFSIVVKKTIESYVGQPLIRLMCKHTEQIQPLFHTTYLPSIATNRSSTVNFPNILLKLLMAAGDPNPDFWQTGTTGIYLMQMCHFFLIVLH